MQSIQEIDLSVCHHLRGIFCDLDDTLTTNGKLLEASYHALWKAFNKGLRVVIVTGRPAGWADHIARMWPVNAVVGENGAFYFWMEGGKMCRYFIQDTATRCKGRKLLEDVKIEIFRQVPAAAISADQQYRESDLAIDYCEDIVPLSYADIEKIMDIFQRQGAKVKISSIHINGWYGEFDKLSTCRLLLQNLWQEFYSQSIGDYIYCGDSPNDEPMFAGFQYSVGVANIAPWLSRMKFHPGYVTSLVGGEGFAEMVDCILEKR